MSLQREASLIKREKKVLSMRLDLLHHGATSLFLQNDDQKDSIKEIPGISSPGNTALSHSSTSEDFKVNRAEGKKTRMVEGDVDKTEDTQGQQEKALQRNTQGIKVKKRTERKERNAKYDAKKEETQHLLQEESLQRNTADVKAWAQNILESRSSCIESHDLTEPDAIEVGPPLQSELDKVAIETKSELAATSVEPKHQVCTCVLSELQPLQDAQLQQEEFTTEFQAAQSCILSSYGYLEISALKRELRVQFRGRPPAAILQRIHAVERMTCSLTTTLWGYVGCNHLCTLYDLEQIVLQHKDFKGAKTFDDLGIGSILRFPLVVRLFSLPPDVTTFPRITTVELVQVIADDMGAYNSDYNPKDSITKYCQEKYGCTSLAHAGVRCSGSTYICWVFSLAKRAFMRSSAILNWAFSKTIRMHSQMNSDTTGIDLYTTLKHILVAKECKTIQDKYQLIKKFLQDNFSASPINFGCLASMVLFALVQIPPCSPQGRALSQMAQEKLVEATLLKEMYLADTGLTGCLQRLENSFMNILGVETHSQAPESLIKYVTQHSHLSSAFNLLAQISHDKEINVADEELVKTTKQAIVASHALLKETSWIGQSPINLLSEVEASVLRFYEASSFQMFERTSFLRFCQSHFNELGLKKYLDPSLLFGNSDSVMDVNKVRKVLQAAFELVPSQSVSNKRYFCAKVLLQHYGYSFCLQHVQPITALIEEAVLIDKLPDTKNTVSASAIAVALSDTSLSEEDAQMLYSSVFSYANFADKNQAISILCSAPELVDLALWSHWHTVFEPSFGDLELFMENTTIPNAYFAQLQANTIIRWDPKRASLRTFQETIATNNGKESACCLVSLVFQEGISVPLQLLGDMVKTHLSLISDEARMKFVLDAVSISPDVLLLPLVYPVLISPLRTFGNAFEMLRSWFNMHDPLRLYMMNVHTSLEITTEPKQKPIEMPTTTNTEPGTAMKSLVVKQLSQVPQNYQEIPNLQKETEKFIQEKSIPPATGITRVPMFQMQILDFLGNTRYKIITNTVGFSN